MGSQLLLAETPRQKYLQERMRDLKSCIRSEKRFKALPALHMELGKVLQELTCLEKKITIGMQESDPQSVDSSLGALPKVAIAGSPLMHVPSQRMIGNGHAAAKCFVAHRVRCSYAPEDNDSFESHHLSNIVSIDAPYGRFYFRIADDRTVFIAKSKNCEARQVHLNQEDPAFFARLTHERAAT